MEMKPVDSASIAHLNGIFAPIQEEIDVEPLEVVPGAIPRELMGVYLRNGPNCRFPPLGSYTYPLDGDGMLHAIELADDRGTGLCRHVCHRRRNASVLLSNPERWRQRRRANRDSTDPSSSPSRIPRLLGPREMSCKSWSSS